MQNKIFLFLFYSYSEGAAVEAIEVSRMGGNVVEGRDNGAMNMHEE